MARLNEHLPIVPNVPLWRTLSTCWHTSLAHRRDTKTTRLRSTRTPGNWFQVTGHLDWIRGNFSDALVYYLHASARLFLHRAFRSAI